MSACHTPVWPEFWIALLQKLKNSPGKQDFILQRKPHIRQDQNFKPPTVRNTIRENHGHNAFSTTKSPKEKSFFYKATWRPASHAKPLWIVVDICTIPLNPNYPNQRILLNKRLLRKNWKPLGFAPVASEDISASLKVSQFLHNVKMSYCH